MTWDYLNVLCSPGLVAESSAANSSDGAPSALSSSTPSVERSFSKDSGTDCSRTPFRCGMISRPSTGDPGVDWWISSLEASRARTSQPQEEGKDSTENGADCGGKWPVSWVRYDLLTSSWRTRQYSLLGGLDEFLGTWPKWGLMRAGECWARDMPGHLIDGTESGSSGPTLPKPAGNLWPTPSASLHNLNEDPSSFLDRQEKWKGTYSNSVPLTVAVKLVAPGARPAGSFGASGAYATGRSADAQESMTGTSSTARERRLWPTPQSRDWRSGSVSDKTFDKNCRPLPEVVAQQVPGALNPDWVEWLMGWPTGWTSLEPLIEPAWFSPTWWEEEPDIPWTTEIKTHRNLRLKAIGNGQVPACVALAWGLLSKG